MSDNLINVTISFPNCIACAMNRDKFKCPTEIKPIETDKESNTTLYSCNYGHIFDENGKDAS